MPMPNTYHFEPKQSREDLVLSHDFRVSGLICQYLKSFQVDGIRFLFKHYNAKEACILNDESSLGKTVTVSVFLGTVLPQNASKKCLIIVKDEERSTNWQFHLNLLTKLPVEVLTSEEEEITSHASVYISKWSVLKTKAKVINQFKFDYIIIDSRDDMLLNKFCMGLLLANYVNKVSLVVSSADMTADLELFHSILRLCGRLDKQLLTYKTFEAKFGLPKMTGVVANRELMESYFVGREKIINFCGDYRLRRYCHQYEGHLPLVDADEYQKNIKIWKNQPIQYSSTDSGSVHIVTSSEKSAEDLLQTYFVSKSENIDNNEVKKLSSQFSPIEVFASIDEEIEDDDVVVMSPLLFEEDELELEIVTGAKEEDSIVFCKAKQQTIIASADKEVTEVLSETSVETEIRPEPIRTRRQSLLEEIERKRVTRSVGKPEENLKTKRKYVKKQPKNIQTFNVKKEKKSTKQSVDSDKEIAEVKKETKRYTRSVKVHEIQKNREYKKSKKSKHTTKSIISEEKSITDNTEVIPYSQEVVQRRIKKTLRDLEIDFTPKYQNQVKNEMTRRANRINRELKKQKKYANLKRGLESPKKNRTPKKAKIVDETLTEESCLMQNAQKPFSQLASLEPIFKVPHNDLPLTPDYLAIDFNRRLNELGQNDVCFVSSEKEVPTIVVSSCTEDEEGHIKSSNIRKRKPTVPKKKPTGPKKKLTGSKVSSKITPSPDLFSTADDVSLPCSQKEEKTFEGFKIFGSEVNQSINAVPFGGGRSCLDILDKQFQKAVAESPNKAKLQSTNILSSSDPDCIFEITTNNTFGNMIRVNDNDEMSPMKNKFFNVPNGNKITKYFAGSHPITWTPSESERSLPVECPKTPKQQKTNATTNNIIKRSPKPCSINGKTQSNKLTKWLIKRSASAQKPSTSAGATTPKRRRLDLSFK